MKRLVFSIIFLVAMGISMYAQDVITLRNGDEIKAKVTEITSSEIKYKRFDNFDGPTVVIAKSDVFFINYENGTREVFNTVAANESSVSLTPSAISSGQLTAVGTTVYQEGLLLSRNQTRDVMAGNPQALQLYDKGIRKQRNAPIFYIIGIGMITTSGILVSNEVIGIVDGVILLGTGIGFSIPGLTMPKKAKRLVSNAVNTYNGNANFSRIDLKVGLTGNGVGLVLNF